MSQATARTDTKMKKATLVRKKTDEPGGGKLSPTHSEIEQEKIAVKVIDGDDIQSLAIKDEDLKKLNKTLTKNALSKLDKPKETVLVRKKNPNAYPTIEVKVAKLVPDKPVKPIDTTDALGLRYDKYGNCVPHSILGNVEDFLQESVANGQSIQLPYDTVDSDRPEANLYLKTEYDTQNNQQQHLIGDFGANALNNWDSNMKIRKNIQKHLATKTKRPVNNLVLNQSDNFLHYNETKTLIDRTLPFIENGKGYRLGSEFWNQHILIGSEENGIHMSLTKSERGELPTMELISKPDVILEETKFDDKQPALVSYPWSQSKYLSKRIETLKPLIKEIVPFRPKFDKLQVVGENTLNPKSKYSYISENSDHVKISEDDNTTIVNQMIINQQNTMNDPNDINVNNPYYINIDPYDDPLSAHADVIEPPIFGPCLIFGGQKARWNGNMNENQGLIALESRLNFETKAGKRVLATFEIINIGTTTVYYDWRKLQDLNPFQIVNQKVQRFYFDTRSNVILPGDLLKLHIVFKSQKGGIFKEKWEFITHPPMLSGASLILTLRGVAIQEDKFKRKRISIERKLFVKEAEIIAKSIVDLIVSGVRTPERPSSPINAFITEEDIFVQKNPSFHYDHDSVQEIKKLYDELFNEEPLNESGLNIEEPLVKKSIIRSEWNLSIDDLKQTIMELDEHDPKKQYILSRLNNLLSSMFFSSDKPNHSQMYSICYNILCSTVDEIAIELSNLKGSFNLPSITNDENYPQSDEFNKLYEDWKKEFEIFKQLEAEKRNRQEKEKGKDGGKGNGGNKKGDKKDDKKKEIEKKKATPVQSAIMASRSRISREQQSRSTSRNQEKIDERTKTPIQLNEQQLISRNYYINKAHINVYQLLYKTIDQIENNFEDISRDVNINEVLSTYIYQTLDNRKTSDFVDYID